MVVKIALIVQLAMFFVVAGGLVTSDPRFAAAQALLFGVNLLLFWPVLTT